VRSAASGRRVSPAAEARRASEIKAGDVAGTQRGSKARHAGGERSRVKGTGDMLLREWRHGAREPRDAECAAAHSARCGALERSSAMRAAAVVRIASVAACALLMFAATREDVC